MPPYARITHDNLFNYLIEKQSRDVSVMVWMVIQGEIINEYVRMACGTPELCTM